MDADAKNQFTYWSQRAFNRPGNKGIRLDYFICSPDLFSATSTAAVAENPGAENGAHHAKKGVAGAASAAAVEQPAQVQVYDSYILHGDTVGCSDHCPVVLVLKL